MERWLAIAGSVVLHLLIIGILFFAAWEKAPTPTPSPHKPIIQARAVDEATAMAAVRAREAEERRKADEKRKVEEQRKQAEAEKKRKAVEAEKLRKQAEAEKQRQAALKRKKAEEEKKRKEEQRKKDEAEKKRLAEEKRKKEEAERKRKEQEDLERRKADLKRQLEEEAERLAAEEQARYSRQLASDTNLYKTLVEQHIGRHWSRPTGSAKDFSCKVLVKQIPNGEVVDVRVVESCGTMALDRSVEAAVRKASPLPLPENRDVFDRELVITFIPSDRN